MPSCEICGCSLSFRRTVLNLVRTPRQVRCEVRPIGGEVTERNATWLCRNCFQASMARRRQRHLEQAGQVRRGERIGPKRSVVKVEKIRAGISVEQLKPVQPAEAAKPAVENPVEARSSAPPIQVVDEANPVVAIVPVEPAAPAAPAVVFGVEQPVEQPGVRGKKPVKQPEPARKAEPAPAAESVPVEAAEPAVPGTCLQPPGTDEVPGIPSPAAPAKPKRCRQTGGAEQAKPDVQAEPIAASRRTKGRKAASKMETVQPEEAAVQAAPAAETEPRPAEAVRSVEAIQAAVPAVAAEPGMPVQDAAPAAADIEAPTATAPVSGTDQETSQKPVRTRTPDWCGLDPEPDSVEACLAALRSAALRSHSCR
jgi:hypothetical protein